MEIKREDVNLQERYIKGGVKTESGKNRIVPIHSKIFKYVEKWYNKGNEYLITNSQNKKMLYRNWKDEKFGKIMANEFEMSMVGKLSSFLGLSIAQTDEGIFILQTFNSCFSIY